MRNTSHTQKTEPPFEYFLSEMRFRKTIPYIKTGAVVADIGCGYHGNFLNKISHIIEVGVGYDVSVTKNKLPKNIVLKRVDINRKFETRTRYFDIVTALAVLEHVKNPENFMNQIKHMLNKGGKVIITTPHVKGKKILEFLSLKLGLISKNEIEDHKTYFNQVKLRKLFKKAGFKIVTIDTFEFGWNLFAVAEKIN